MIEILFFITVVFLSISVYFNIKLGIIILNVEDAVEECLDQLDEKYKIFSKILEKPVFFDSVEVRQVIQEIRGSQELILIIANKLASLGGSSKNEEKRQ